MDIKYIIETIKENKENDSKIYQNLSITKELDAQGPTSIECQTAGLADLVNRTFNRPFWFGRFCWVIGLGFLSVWTAWATIRFDLCITGSGCPIMETVNLLSLHVRLHVIHHVGTGIQISDYCLKHELLLLLAFIWVTDPIQLMTDCVGVDNIAPIFSWVV